MSYSVLTPYIIPPELSSHKKQNVGDGFILIAIKKLLRPFEAEFEFSTRRSLTADEIEKINSTKALIIAGANQLNDKYTIFPGANLDSIRQIKVPIIFMGVGYSGFDDQNSKMSNLTHSLLIEAHKTVEFSSWRCLRTMAYLNKNIPEIKGKILMTGCPVIYGDELLGGKPFSSGLGRVAVSITERGRWFSREKSTIDFVARKYGGSELFLVLHQDLATGGLREMLSGLKNLQPPASIIRWYAKLRGFKILVPKTAEECQDFYNTCDLHIGSRVHAHLYCLGASKRSFLTYVDDRAISFADYLKFPVVKPGRIDQYLDYDFETYRRNALASYKTMKKFIDYLKEEVL